MSSSASARSSTSASEAGGRVIHVLHVLSSLGRGGAERALSDIVAASDRQRFRHTICYLGGEDDLVHEFRESGCETICLNAGGSLPWRAGARALRRIVAEKRPDIVQSATFEANIAARLGASGAGAPLLSWIVSMEYDPASVRAAGWPRGRNFARRVLDVATGRLTRSHYVACSAAVLRSTVERLHVPPRRIELIYNPVNLAALEPAPGEVEALRRELGLPETAFVYLSIGRLDPPKDHKTLLRAFGQAAEGEGNACLVILGRGPLAGPLEAEAQALGVSERVRVVRGAPRVAPFFGLAGAFVFPSLLEGLPVALLEGMCVGLPCIASDIEPHVEVVRQGETGLLFPRGSPAALAAAMEAVRADADLRERLGAAARKEAEALVATTVVLPQWEAAWERLAGGAGRP
jgi:glycosyltransferase involved in cell wall biosynthesis